MNTGRSSWRHRAVHTVHRIPKAQFKVTNWAECEAGLRRLGSLTLWITEEAIDAWGAAPRATPDGQTTFSESAIQTCLMLRMAFKLPLRPAEGLMSSVVELLRIEMAVPGHTTVSRRAGRQAIGPILARW